MKVKTWSNFQIDQMNVARNKYPNFVPKMGPFYPKMNISWKLRSSNLFQILKSPFVKNFKQIQISKLN